MVSKWNGTVVAELRFESGDDTTNKDVIVWTTTNNKSFSEDPKSYSWVEITDGLLKMESE